MLYFGSASGSLLAYLLLGRLWRGLQLGAMLAALLATVIEAKAESMGQLLVFPIATTFGFIPVFIYGAWLGAQLRAG